MEIESEDVQQILGRPLWSKTISGSLQLSKNGLLFTPNNNNAALLVPINEIKSVKIANPMVVKTVKQQYRFGFGAWKKAAYAAAFGIGIGAGFPSFGGNAYIEYKSNLKEWREAFATYGITLHDWRINNTRTVFKIWFLALLAIGIFLLLWMLLAALITFFSSH